MALHRREDVDSNEHAREAETHLNAAVDGLRRAGTEHNLPWGLLARAAFYRAQSDFPAVATDLAIPLDAL